MIEILKRRKLRKHLKDYLHAAKHARHMREDIANPEDISLLLDAEAAVAAIYQTGTGDAEPAINRLADAIEKVYPAPPNAGVRENVEVIIVALAAAMAIRAFFFQPFKIPTGSMQPTLNGILLEQQSKAGVLDRQPLKFVKWLFTGESYKVYRAKVSGNVTRSYGDRDKLYVEIGGVSHKIPRNLYEAGYVQLRDFYSKGDVIAACKVIAGDHILVNKMKYNFMRPQRGDVAVFDTRHIDHPEVREKTFYIKRMVGLSGEKIQVQNGRLVANGKIVTTPPIFEKIATAEEYSGHGNAGQLSRESDVLQVGADEYLMFGDNTHHSLDGRYFGGVKRDDFLGPAFFVYWPFRSHWGMVH
ncbi:MAG: signal peptidase I [Kiritimatiellales bacterium]|nr:signal peptidase I [Kiritimatiellales bacterium]